ncbi:Mitochondrial translocator assembly and maintenance protein 41 [Orbilia oligospora]|nr:Mitochondrial translocator assembly and maintenance protein 41 [Orbilia oligospora]KAF3150798.1 Mitochondrial translocator assembly and maintenance protein 41 [Orbilia oligospora]
MTLGTSAARPAARLLAASVLRYGLLVPAPGCLAFNKSNSSSSSYPEKYHHPQIHRRNLVSTPTYLQEKPPSSSSESSSSSSSVTPTSSDTANNSLFTYETQEPVYDSSKYDYRTLPQSFGANQYMSINDDLRRSLRHLLWEFKAPIRYAFAYGSGVFSQGTSSKDKPMVDLIFGVTYTQHWHSLNLTEHRDHYSFLGKMGSGVVAKVQDGFGAGVYFNTYVEVNGMMIKYGVVNLDTFCRDLADWETLYLAGRMHKPVKILRDDARVRLANQANLLSALRVALLLLPEEFTEQQLYHTIAGISYLGDPRMNLFTENPHKVANIVSNQLPNFRSLYAPLVDTLPNLVFKNHPHANAPKDTVLLQDMDVVRRGNMVRRLPKAFRKRLYFQYQRKWQIPQLEFEKLVGTSEEQEMMEGRQGGEFEQRIAADMENIRKEVKNVIKGTINWPSTSQSFKGFFTTGFVKTWRYLGEKIKKWRTAKKSPEAGKP